MCDISKSLGLSSDSKAVKMPKPVAPAPPAPQRRQDTGAIVAVGDLESEYSDERRRAAARASSRTGGTALGTLGQGTPIL